jgi:hypothetical protein
MFNNAQDALRFQDRLTAQHWPLEEDYAAARHADDA